MIKRALTIGVALLAPLTSHGSEPIASELSGAPAFVLPSFEPASEVKPEPVLDPMRDAIQEEIQKRYQDEDPVDGERLRALIDGSYIDSYETGAPAPVKFSNAPFMRGTPSEGQPVEDEPQAGAAGQDLSNFLTTPQGIRALSMMNGQQIEAIAVMLEMMQGKAGAVAGMGGSHASMTYGDPRMAMGGPGMRTIDVGNGRDMFLSTWSAGIDEDGSFHIVSENLPGSQITVATGDVVGEFGRVVETRIDPSRGAVVTFESGDMIAQFEAPSLDDGIPALGAEDLGAETAIPGDNLSGEIIVSAPAPVRPGQSSAPDKADTPARPKPKPEQVGR